MLKINSTIFDKINFFAQIRGMCDYAKLTGKTDEILDGTVVKSLQQLTTDTLFSPTEMD